MQKLFNAITGQVTEWVGTLEHFYASSDADQAGQWTAESAPVEIPPTPAPLEIAPEPIVEPTTEVVADAPAEGVI